MATAPAIEDDAGAAVAAPANDAATPLTEVEELAVEMGWKPQADYTGPEGKWKPAREYVRAERDISDGLKSSVKSLKDTVERLASTSTKQTERALKQQADEINGRWEKAVKDGDHQGVRAAERDMRSLESVATTDTTTAEQQFGRDNPWYGKDDDATAYAVSISQREAAKGKSVAEQLEAATAGVRKRFPELFTDPRPQPKPQPGVAEPSSRAAGGKQRIGFADLPPDAQAAGIRYGKLFAQKFGGKPEDYHADFAADYFANKAGA